MGGPTGWRFTASQSWAVPSMLPVRIVLPSGLNAAPEKPPRFIKGRPLGRPLATSQNRAVPS
jgi:hypothetical protein